MADKNELVVPAGNSALLPAALETYGVLTLDLTEVSEVIRENLGDRAIKPSDLDRIRIPAGGGTLWTIPGLDGDEDTKVWEGIIVHWKESRAYWAKSYDGSKTPPDCYSDNLHFGIGNPSGDCETCPLSKFGSKEGTNAQACKQVRMLFVIRPGNLLPVVLALPPTSIQASRNYFMRLASLNRRYYSLTTRFTLEKTKNTGGIDYSQVRLDRGTDIPADYVMELRKYVDAIRPVLDAVTVDSTDANGGSSEVGGQA